MRAAGRCATRARSPPRSPAWTSDDNGGVSRRCRHPRARGDPGVAGAMPVCGPLDARFRGHDGYFESRLQPAPHLGRDLDDALELAALHVLGDAVAVVGAGEAALRAEAEVLERDELGGGVDAALERVLG